jgi:hypothetical protein
MQSLEYPGGKRFAFTILDDTDVATVENVKPFYDFLYELGLRTTKTIWPVRCPEGSRNFSMSQTLEDEDYRDFVLELQSQGFEITWHGATMESSLRERTSVALERFRDMLGTYPRIHVNHACNRENLYWGVERLDHRVVRSIYARLSKTPAGFYVGQVESSPYWWGDLCQRHFVYARNLTTNDINTRGFNPSMPYRDPARPLIPWWFSASDAEDVVEFNELLRSENQKRLEAESGFCVIATHFGKGYVRNGEVDRVTRRRLEELVRRPGWFAPVGELLDWLRGQRQGETLPPTEWQRMQWRFVFDLGLRWWARKQRKRKVMNGESQ